MIRRVVICRVLVVVPRALGRDETCVVQIPRLDPARPPTHPPAAQVFGAPPTPERPASGAREREQATLEALLAHHRSRGARPEAVSRALAAVDQTQRSVLVDPPRGRFVFVRMNPAAGLGNRLVAMVSALLLAAATDRGFLVDWEAYSDPRTHRSREISTMAQLEHFFDLPFVCDASALLGTPQSQNAFGWDYQQWRQLHDENVDDMRVLHTHDVHSALPQRVVVISAISYFGQLLLANPSAAHRLAPLRHASISRPLLSP